MLTVNDLRNNEINIGNDVAKSVYILADGILWDGMFDCGSRGVEHREAEQFSEYGRYDGDLFWNDVLIRMALVMVIPETKQIYIHPKYKPTIQQKAQINIALKNGFRITEEI